MEKNRRSIISMIIALVVVIVLIVFIIIQNNRNKVNMEPDEPIGDDTPAEVLEYRNNTKGKIQLVDRGDLFRAKSILQKYYSLCNYIVTGDTEDRDLMKSQIISMLNDDYVASHNISIDNIAELVGLDETYLVEIFNIYLYTNYEDTKSYFVNGLLRNMEDKSIYKEFNLALNVDQANLTFEILPAEQISNIDIVNLKELDVVDYTIPESVKDKTYNHYSDVSVTLEEVSREYLSIVTNMLLYDIDRAYDHLSDNGKARYTSKNALQQFVDNNKVKVFSLIYGGNTIDVDGNKNTLTIYDQYRRYYIVIEFNVFSSFKFDIYEIS